MDCKALSRPKIKSNQAWLLTYSYRTKLGCCPDEQVSKLGDLDTVFRMDCFLLLLFYFLLISCRILNRMIGTRLTKAVSWIGKISFSLYLIHFPLFKLFGYLHREIFGEKPANFLISLFYLLPVIFLAWLFFRVGGRPNPSVVEEKKKS